MMDSLRSPAFLALVLLCIGVELIWRRRRSRYDLTGAAASFGVAIGNGVLSSVSALVIAPIYKALHDLSPFDWALTDWRAWVAGFFLVEFAYYWMHRWSHTVRWMWASHAVHHSSEEMTFPAAIRLGWTDVLSLQWLAFAPIILLGFDPVLVVTLLVLNLRYQFFLHTDLIGRLGPLELILNTPSHHRVHHACNEVYLDRNFGGVLIVFDRLFGTFAREEAPCRYGLVKPLHSRNPFVIAFHEWARLVADLRRARDFHDGLHALFGPPGPRPGRSLSEHLAAPNDTKP